MNPEIRWDAEPVFKWMNALSVSAATWAKPFLPVSGLPPELCDQAEWLGSVHAQASEQQEAIWESIRTALPREEWEAALTQGVVTFILTRIANRFGDSVAENFAGWARRSIVRDDWGTALSYWRIILQAQASDPIPEVVVSIQRVEFLISREREAAFNVDVKRASPPPTEDDLSLGVDISLPALILEQAAQHDWTYKALQEIGNTLSLQSRLKFLEWAQDIARRKGYEASCLMSDTLVPGGAS